jgi:hypothetical protein
MKSRLFSGARRIGGRGIGVAPVLLLSLLIHPHQLLAQALPDLRDAEVTGRIEFIQGALDDGRKGANLWTWGWFAAYGAGTVAQGAIFATSDDEQERQDMLVGGITSALGAAGQVVFPLRTGRYARALRAMPEATLDDRRAKLAAAESWLRDAAEEQRFGKSWKTRLLSLSVNATAGLVTSLVFDRPATDGLIVFGIGQVVSEVQMLTQPARAIRDLEAYVKGAGGDRLSADGRPNASWSVALGPSHVSVSRRF